MSGERDTAAAGADRQRLDKWLWHTRLQPTRSQAARFIRDGFVRINGMRVIDPAKPVRTGDVLTLALHNKTLAARIRQLLPRRVSPALALAAWENLSPDESGPGSAGPA